MGDLDDLVHPLKFQTFQIDFPLKFPDEAIGVGSPHLIIISQIQRPQHHQDSLNTTETRICGSNPSHSPGVHYQTGLSSMLVTEAGHFDFSASIKTNERQMLETINLLALRRKTTALLTDVANSFP